MFGLKKKAQDPNKDLTPITQEPTKKEKKDTPGVGATVNTAALAKQIFPQVDPWGLYMDTQDGRVWAIGHLNMLFRPSQGEPEELLFATNPETDMVTISPLMHSGVFTANDTTQSKAISLQSLLANYIYVGKAHVVNTKLKAFVEKKQPAKAPNNVQDKAAQNDWYKETTPPHFASIPTPKSTTLPTFADHVPSTPLPSMEKINPD